MKAWIDPHWYEGDGMMVVHAQESEAARRALDMDCGSEPQPFPVMDGLEGRQADVDAWAAMIGAYRVTECIGCGRRMEHQFIANTNMAVLIGDGLSWSTRPVRVPGAGILCSWECYQASPWGRGVGS